MRFNSALFLASILCVTGSTIGQISVNDPSKWVRSGLSVVSSQNVPASPTRMRMFTTVWTTESNAKDSLKKLSQMKRDAQTHLESIGAVPSSIEFSPTKFLRLNFPDNENFWGYQYDWGLRIPSTQPSSFTAYCSLKVDWQAPDGSDELLIFPFEILESIKSNRIFDSEAKEVGLSKPDIVMLLIGEVSNRDCDAALERAFEEAKSDAKKQASLAGKKIGKIQYLNSHFVESWRGTLMYPVRQQNNLNGESTRTFEDPMSSFRLAPNEVYSSTFDKLERVFNVEIQYELE